MKVTPVIFRNYKLSVVMKTQKQNKFIVKVPAWKGLSKHS